MEKSTKVENLRNQLQRHPDVVIPLLLKELTSSTTESQDTLPVGCVLNSFKIFRSCTTAEQMKFLSQMDMYLKKYKAHPKNGDDNSPATITNEQCPPEMHDIQNQVRIELQDLKHTMVRNIQAVQQKFSEKLKVSQIQTREAMTPIRLQIMKLEDILESAQTFIEEKLETVKREITNTSQTGQRELKMYMQTIRNELKVDMQEVRSEFNQELLTFRNNAERTFQAVQTKLNEMSEQQMAHHVQVTRHQDVTTQQLRDIYTMQCQEDLQVQHLRHNVIPDVVSAIPILVVGAVAATVGSVPIAAGGCILGVVPLIRGAYQLYKGPSL